MTITSVGVRLGIFGPPPVAPARSLLKTPGIVVEDGDRRWANGVNYQPYPAPKPNVWTPCNSGTGAEKSETDVPDAEIFDPVAVYLQVTCSTNSMAGLQERAVASLEAGLSTAIESVLAQGDHAGVSPSDNPYLADSGVHIIPGTLKPRAGLALIEEWIGEHYGAQGTIIAGPGTVDTLSDVLSENESGTIYTQAGTPIIPAQGFANVKPDAHPEPVLTNTGWIFATAGIEVRMTDTITRNLVQSLDRSDNTVSFIVERFALVTFDPQLQVAVHVDYTL